MKPFLHYPITLILLATSFCLGGNPTAGNIDIEWIHSREVSAMFSLPRTAWLSDGTAILLDTALPDENLAFEYLSPEKADRKKGLNYHTAARNLKNAFAINFPRQAFWPAAFDRQGKNALYQFGSDLFVMSLITGEFTRLTQSEPMEKCARFSPDGLKVAFVRDNDLFVCNINGKQETRLTTDGSETLLNGTLSWVYWEEIFGREDLAYWWSDDSRSIAYLKTDESELPVSYFVDNRQKRDVLIKQRYPKAGDPTPVVSLHTVNLDTKRTVSISRNDIPYEYLIRVKWLPDNRRVSIQTLDRSQRRMDLYFIGSRTKKIDHVLTDTDDAWITMSNDLYFLKTKEQFILSSERDGYNHLYRFKYDGTLVNQITRGPWSLFTSGQGVFWVNQSVQAIDEERETVYFTALEKSSVERHLYAIKFDGSGMKRLSREDGTHAIAFAPDGRHYLDRFSNITTPPVLMLCSNKGKAVRTLARSGQDFPEEIQLQFPELFTVKTRDGFPMPATLLKPADFNPDKKYPVVINVYGGPGAPTVLNTWGRSILMDQILAENGFLVFRVDNRQATGISKKLSAEVQYKLIGQRELDDILDAVEWLKSQSFVDGDRLGIHGWSGGGGMTYNAMTRSDQFKAGVAGAALASWYNYNVKLTEMANKRPQDNTEGYAHTDLVSRAKDLHGRLLIMHGTYDDNVHPQHAYQFADALIDAGIVFEMMLYPMRKHGFADRPAQIHRDKVMLDFWKRNL